LNFFLHINRKLIIFIGGIIVFFFLLFVFYKQTNLNSTNFQDTKNKMSNADISQPKFSINNESKKIYITATEGNFLGKDKVLLKNNVRFKSDDFSIETEKVIFNRNEQTAESETKSLFTSTNTKIFSDGFNINDSGNKIIFHGKSHIVLK
tara:strand:- start:189 stop:638 length:450 start_codon:yes stop_codon:yes gene_type:complete